MTINRAALFAGWENVRHVAVVIIAVSALSVRAAAAADSLTTETPALATAPATTLTTVIVDGSSVYGPAQLFAAYRDQLGRPLSRDGARAIAGAISSALAGRYTMDGYV